MKARLAIAAVAFGLSTAGAFAQTATDTSAPTAAPQTTTPSRQAPGLDKPITGQPDRLDRPPPRPGGARYRVTVGGSAIDIRCAADEPTKDCGELLLQIIDKLSNKSDDQDFNDDDESDSGPNDNQRRTPRREQMDNWTRG